jgi:hypothetical protein
LNEYLNANYDYWLWLKLLTSLVMP